MQNRSVRYVVIITTTALALSNLGAGRLTCPL